MSGRVSEKKPGHYAKLEALIPIANVVVVVLALRGGAHQAQIHVIRHAAEIIGATTGKHYPHSPCLFVIADGADCT